jgi:large subunit ribosomal protein L25
MEELVLNARVKHDKGKGANHRLRAQGLVPAVLYGDDQPSEMLAVEAKEIEKLLHRYAGEAVIVTLKINDGEQKGTREQKTLVKDSQREPVTNRIVHVDFYRVSARKPIRVEVPIHGTGIPAGVKAGGILEHLARTIEIKCLPTQVPRFIEVDLTELAINHSIHVSNLKVTEGIEILSEPETVLFTVVPPKVEEVPVPAAAEVTEEAAEPELVKKKKEEEEEGEEEKAKEGKGKEERGKEERGKEEKGKEEKK